MNAESQNDCSHHRDELLLLACGDIAPGDFSPAARDHLSTCAACRESLDESRELIAAVTKALRPEPLPLALQRRIHERLDAAALTRAPGRLRRLHIVSTAAAACLLTAMFTPQVQRPRADMERIVVTDHDAAEIVAAYGLLCWDAPLDYSIDQVDAVLADLEQLLQRKPGSSALLPWDAEDDWDVPAAGNETLPSSPQRSSLWHLLGQTTT
jgi:hypothetical protein